MRIFLTFPTLQLRNFKKKISQISAASAEWRPFKKDKGINLHNKTESKAYKSATILYEGGSE